MGRKTPLVLGFLVVALVSGCVTGVSNNAKENSNKSQITSEFPPLALCRTTGGDWSAVSANAYPLNESAGVYNPTTNVQTNYKCFCPSGESWNLERGCEQ